MTRESVRRAIRIFLKTALGLFIPGLLGWIHDLTTWANGQGSTPFPDAHGLAYLGVAAIAAGFVALVSLVWDAVENATGTGVLRTVTPEPSPDEISQQVAARVEAALRGDVGPDGPELGEH